MSMQSLEDLYMHELRDLYDVENQLVPALQKMASAASSPALAEAFEEHRAQTQTHLQRLDQIFSGSSMSPQGKTCQVIQQLVQAGDRIIADSSSPEAKDAALIAAAQKVEHFEMAAYGSARSWAKELGYDDAADLLQQSLNEEGAADHKLSKIAVRQTNVEARQAA